MAEGTNDDDAYSGLLDAFPYAFRASDSLLFRSYVALGGLLALFVALAFVTAVVVVLGNTAAAAGGTVTVSRAFFVVVALFVFVPVVAPVLLGARRHRRTGSDTRHDAALAAAGYLFVLSLYVGLVISIPPEQQRPVGGAIAPVVAFLYSLPGIVGLLPPLLGAGAILLADRFA